MVDKRSTKALNIEVTRVIPDGPMFKVRSEGGNSEYQVYFDKETKTCTCTDWKFRIKKDPKHRCKHIRAVELLLVKERFGLENVVIIDKKDLEQKV